MGPEAIKDLLEKYNAGNCTAAERAFVESWYIQNTAFNNAPPSQQIKEDQYESLNLLTGHIYQKPASRFWPNFSVAASILVLFSVGAYLLTAKRMQQPLHLAHNKTEKHDVIPGGNKAVITLANGSTVLLNGAKNGVLASQGNMVISKTADGKVVYHAAGQNPQVTGLSYNTATTPRGGQYQFTLADGTKVWLNSASSIKYPVAFNGTERKVELTGEAYFEVAHNAKLPFRVVSGNQTVEVLGTHFNINAYADEDMVKTTLAQGSVKVITASGSRIIKPGEQAQQQNGSLNIAQVDVDEALAWKNGFFYFKDNNITEVMRQLSRWYDVSVKTEGALPERRFSGEISRNVNLAQLLDILSFKRIHFSIEGKLLTVKD